MQLTPTPEQERSWAQERIAWTLDRLLKFDSEPVRQGDRQRFMCPLSACLGKCYCDYHRCLSVNEQGYYRCHRCGAKGRLTGFTGNSASARPNKRPRRRGGRKPAELRKRFEV